MKLHWTNTRAVLLAITTICAIFPLAIQCPAFVLCCGVDLNFNVATIYGHCQHSVLQAHRRSNGTVRVRHLWVPGAIALHTHTHTANHPVRPYKRTCVFMVDRSVRNCIYCQCQCCWLIVLLVAAGWIRSWLLNTWNADVVFARQAS